MDLALLVYGISLLGGFHAFLGAIIVASVIAAVITGIYTSTHAFDGAEYSWNLDREGKLKERIASVRRRMASGFKYSLITLACVAFLSIFIPSEKTAYIMVGAYATQKVAENEKVQETGQKVLTIINQKLDSYVEENIKAAEKIANKAVDTVKEKK
jgi:hypothetical protein